MSQKEIDILAKKVWNYHHVNHILAPADALFILCSHDLRVAEYAAKLFKEKYAPLILISEGIAHKGDLVETPWEKPESEVFADRLIELGIPKEKIILETKATNCGENVLFMQKVLQDNNIQINSLIAIQKPYMKRRTFATIKKHWPDKKLIVSSPKISYQDYPNKNISKSDLINIIVGDLQRIKFYPEKGFQIYQEIPTDVWDSYEKLLALGFTKHLMKN